MGKIQSAGGKEDRRSDAKLPQKRKPGGWGGVNKRGRAGKGLVTRRGKNLQTYGLLSDSAQ